MDVLDHLRGKLREMMNDKADDVAMGGASDFADYKHRVGVIEGLALAEREIVDMIERLQSADE